MHALDRFMLCSQPNPIVQTPKKLSTISWPSRSSQTAISRRIQHARVRPIDTCQRKRAHSFFLRESHESAHHLAVQPMRRVQDSMHGRRRPVTDALMPPRAGLAGRPAAARRPDVRPLHLQPWSSSPRASASLPSANAAAASEREISELRSTNLTHDQPPNQALQQPLRCELQEPALISDHLTCPRFM
jgi:hypothetical protein